jgi:nucleoside-diphosphate-sugar epimerase
MEGSEMTVYGDGSQTRSFCYFTDTVTALLRMVTSTVAKGEIFNIGSSQELSVLELAKKIRSELRSKARIIYKPLPLDDPKRRLPDVTKATKVLDWKAAVDLDTGLVRTVNWFAGRTQ